MTPLVLASTSRYRRELLSRLGLAFTVESPDVDEAELHGEAAAAMAQRLADAKAGAVAARRPGAWIIGSDQVAELDGRPLGKPGNRQRAAAQLGGSSGKTLRFHTAVCLANDAGQRFSHVDCTQVRFRALSEPEILRYLDAEQPYDCAGSFKCEGLGITLFESIRSEDPTALVGLPLIELARILRLAGYRLP